MLVEQNKIITEQITIIYTHKGQRIRVLHTTIHIMGAVDPANTIARLKERTTIVNILQQERDDGKRIWNLIMAKCVSFIFVSIKTYKKDS